MLAMRWVVGLALLILTSFSPALAQDVSREDGLALENLALKMQLHSANVDRIQRDVAQAGQDLQRQRDALAQIIKDRYGVALDRLERQGDKWVVKPLPAKEK